MIIVPLVHDTRVIGALGVSHARPGAYSDADLHLMQRLAEQVAPVVSDAQAFEDLEDYRRHLEDACQNGRGARIGPITRRNA